MYPKHHQRAGQVGSPAIRCATQAEMDCDPIRQDGQGKEAEYHIRQETQYMGSAHCADVPNKFTV